MTPSVVTPSVGDAAAYGSSRRWWILVLVQVSTLLNGMAITATNVVLPQVRGTLSLSQDEAAWTVTLFLVAAAVATPLTGWLAGRLGWRRFSVATLIGFTLASLGCGLANSFEALLAARIAQGLFGAPTVPLGQGMLLAVFPRHMHPFVLMLWGTGSVMGPVLGPILAGVIADTLNWRWAFLLMAPLGALAAVLAMFALGNQERGTAGRFGATGFIALAVGMSCAQLMLDRGHRLDWFDSLEIIVEAALVVAGLAVFIAHTMFARVPFLNPRMFSDWNFCLGIVIAFLMGALSYTPIVLFPTMLQDLRHYPDSTVGLLMSSRGLGNFLSFALVVRATQINARLALIAGLLLQAWAGWQMSLLNVNMTDFDVFWTNLLQGFGFGIAYTPMAVLAFSTLPPALAVQGSAVFNLMRNFGSSLFISLSILVLVRSTAENYAGLSAAVSSTNKLLLYPGLTGGWHPENTPGLSALSAEIQRQASMGGYLNAFALFTFASLLGVPLVWMFRPGKSRG